MKKNGKNEELQSRREFFKKAAKGALPILGAIVLANAPAIVNAAEKDPTGCRGCASNCIGGCSGNCVSCVGSCNNTCDFTCRNHCKTSSGKY